MNVTTWLPTKDDQRLLYSLICSQLEMDGFTKSSVCLKGEMPGLPTSLVLPGNKLEELFRLCISIKKHIDSHLNATHGREILQPMVSSPFSPVVSTPDPVPMEIKSEPVSERSDHVISPPRVIPASSSDPTITNGGLMTPECDVMTTDGGGLTTTDEKVVIASNDNEVAMTPERGVGVSTPDDGPLAPGDAVPTQLSSVFLSPGPSPTPLKEPGVTPENNPEEIALHIQRLIGEEMMKRRLIGGDDNNLLLRGLLNSQNRSFLPTPAVRGLSFDTSLLGQNFPTHLHPLFTLVNNMNNTAALRTTTTTTTTTATKGTKTQRPSKPGSMCRFCGKVFSQQSALLVHERIHTGEKPYHCHYCDKAFTQISNLKCHERLHTGEKPYRCTECGKRFTQSASLRCHMRSHTGERPYVCKYCNKRFTQPASLQHHIRIHTGEKPYKCEECNKCFTQPSSLVVHRRLHTGERPFVCQICGKSYTQAMPLKEHMRIHHVQEKSPLSFNVGKPFSLQGTEEKKPGKME